MQPLFGDLYHLRLRAVSGWTKIANQGFAFKRVNSCCLVVNWMRFLGMFLTILPCVASYTASELSALKTSSLHSGNMWATRSRKYLTTEINIAALDTSMAGSSPRVRRTQFVKASYIGNNNSEYKEPWPLMSGRSSGRSLSAA